MLLTEVILHLRKSCPVFGERVSGTQSFAAATAENSDIDVPCAFVVPMYETATDTSGDGTYQRVTERFAVIVCADNSKDKRHGRGVAAETVMKQARGELLRAFIGWNPLAYQAMDTIKYQRSQHLYMDEARLWHQYEWAGSYYVDGENARTNDTYVHIEKIIAGWFPEVDALKVRQILAGQEGMIPAEYETVIALLEDTTPAWIRHVNPNDEGPPGSRPDQTVYGEHRLMEKPQ